MSKLPQKEITMKIPELGIEWLFEEWEIDVKSETRETHLGEPREWKTYELTGRVRVTVTGKRV